MHQSERFTAPKRPAHAEEDQMSQGAPFTEGKTPGCLLVIVQQFGNSYSREQQTNFTTHGSPT